MPNGGDGARQARQGQAQQALISLFPNHSLARQLNLVLPGTLRLVNARHEVSWQQ